MPKPRPIEYKNYLIYGVIRQPIRIINYAEQILSASGDVRFNLILSLIQEGQNSFDKIKPLLPANHATITDRDWDNAAADRWGPENVPAEGMVQAINNAALAGQAFVGAYMTQLLPAIRDRFYNVDPATGQLVGAARSMTISQADLNLVRTELEAYYAALEPITETINV